MTEVSPQRLERVFVDFFRECHGITIEPGKLNDTLAEIFTSDLGAKINMVELRRRIVEEFGEDYVKAERKF